MTDSLVKLQCKHHEKGLSTHGWPQLIFLYQEEDRGVSLLCGEGEEQISSVPLTITETIKDCLSVSKLRENQEAKLHCLISFFIHSASPSRNTGIQH